MLGGDHPQYWGGSPSILNTRRRHLDSLGVPLPRRRQDKTKEDSDDNDDKEWGRVAAVAADPAAEEFRTRPLSKRNRSRQKVN